MRIGLVLSGGGIKGIAHAGVLQCLQDYGIDIDLIGGTSSGSIVAMLYGMGYAPKEIYNIFKKYAKEIIGINKGYIIKGIKGAIFKRKLELKGLNKGDKLEKIFKKLGDRVNCNNIQDIKNIIIAIPTLNIIKEQKCIFTNCSQIDKKEGNIEYIRNIEISKAVRASSSFPGIFSPCEYKEYLFLDGGAIDNTPVNEIRKCGSDKIITVNFKEDKLKEKYNVLDVAAKTIDIMCLAMNKDNLKSSDITIEVNTNNTGLLDTKRIDECYKAGYEATIKKISQIKLVIAQVINA